jgi:hypothetical protein
MNKERRFIFILAAFMIAFVLFQLFGPKALDWTPSYSPKDKNPFGAFVLNDLLPPIFPDKKVKKLNLTIYELQDSLRENENFVSISDQFAPDDEATKVLFEKVKNGSHVFISANYFSGKFGDTLDIRTTDLFISGKAKVTQAVDTTDLVFSLGKKNKSYFYKLENISLFFEIDSLKAQPYIIATNAWSKPVTIRVPWGKGYFILNTTPLAFTNNYLLDEDNHQFASRTLSYLPTANTWWTSYYQVGRLEAQSPLRFILRTEALRWAYYIAVISLLLFIFFEAKRKQRIIPIVKPLSNTSLEFVQTIGNMYWQARDYKAVAEKKINFFMDQVRSKYYLASESGDRFVELLAKKTGNTLEETQKLFSLMKVVQSATSISAEMLVDLATQMKNFNRKN